jgi:hydrogenase-4 component E
MYDLTNLLLISVILINFFTLGSSRLGSCIRAVAAQGALLALLPLATHGWSRHTLILGVGALALKGVLIPLVLTRALRQVRLRRESGPLIGYIPTMVLGALITSAAFIFADFLPLQPEHRGGLFIPTSLATLFVGFLLLMTRREAISQVLGYLVLENGIFIFGTLLAEAMPLMVEAGVLLDLLVGVFIMGIVMDQIRREFSTLNTERLSALKG